VPMTGSLIIKWVLVILKASVFGAPTNPIAKMREKIMIGEIIFFIFIFKNCELYYKIILQNTQK
jgi:hypothetical protein